MKPIVSLFWRICIFRAGPEAVPLNGTLTGVIIVLNALVNISVQLLLGGESETLLRAVTATVVSLAGTAGLVWFVMLLMSLTQRFAQTITAIIAVDIILTLIAAVLFSLIGDLTNTVSVFVTALLVSWTLAVYGFIFHRAMDMHIGFGVAMALFVFIFTMAITQTALGSP